MNRILLLSFIIYVFSSVSLNGYRMLQYDSGNQQFGSRTSILNSPVIALQKDSLDIGSTSYFTRYVLLVKLETIFENNFWNSTFERTDVLGAVILIPKNFNKKKLFEFESQFLQKTIHKSVYFCYDEEKLHNLFEEIKEQRGLENFHIVVNEKESTVITPLQLFNYQATLHGKEKTASIAIIANYDTVSMIPELTSGVDSNGSGVASLLELARLFSILYSTPNTRGKYNLIFVLTSGGRLNYEGTKHWLRKLSPSAVESIKFSLCLESLLGKELFLHVSEKTNDKEIIGLYQEFQKKATEMKIPFEVVFKKVDAGSQEIPWEHEVLTYRNKLISATLSHILEPKSQFLRSPMVEKSFDVKILERNIKLIAESLAKFIYPNTTDIEVFKGTLDVNTNFVSSWLTTFTSFTRFTPTLTKENPLLSSFKKTLSQYTNEVVEQEFEVNSNIKFYTNSKVNLTIHQVKSLLFDGGLFLLCLIYFIILHVIIVGMSEAKKNLFSIFKK